MKYRYIASFLESPFDLKASRRGNILKIDASERSGYLIYSLNYRIHILRLYAQRKSIHIGKRLKENAFPLHDRHSCLRADVSKAENSGSVGYDRAHVPPSCQLIALARILLYLKAWLRYPGCIRDRKIIPVVHAHPRDHLYLPLPDLMKFF